MKKEKEIKIVEPNIGKWLEYVAPRWCFEDEVIHNFESIEKYCRYFATNLKTKENMIHVDYLTEKIDYMKRQLENIEMICIGWQGRESKYNG